MNTKNRLWSVWTYAFCMVLIVQFSACSEEKHDFATAPEIKDTYIDKLDAVIVAMTDLQQNSDYGNKTGQYPAESRAILSNAIDDANRAVLLIKYQNPAPSASEKERYLKNANDAIGRFKETIRTEDAETIPAELFVDGKTNESYINYGRSKDYTVFGETGNQAFTIEFWVKIMEHGPHDNDIFLCTYMSNSQWRNGWMLYRRISNGGIFRATWAGITASGRRGLWEPSYTAPADKVWQHYVFIQSDKGLDGDPNLRAKLYLNGELKATQTNSNASEVYNSTDYDNYDKPMTGFCRWVNNERMEEGFSGYMKKIRIWKEAKSEEYVIASSKEETNITGKETNLVAAWDFTSKPTGADNEVLDLTGKHTAKLIGTYKWERIK
ncbi:DUF4972 domain-containing protein [Bacteroides sp. 224]|uniref:DUF4972 domain-containing protein n=1 Tax=Bacteroides sp. 224 TaxID=2302936 RepID=UPI0013D4D9D0|nr:DUF4972 domain-containing protein [Bacteroides sp. 224]NDV63720.1 DUF4972 domain-containing protein [Bacteroides sp. 224]